MAISQKFRAASSLQSHQFLILHDYRLVVISIIVAEMSGNTIPLLIQRLSNGRPFWICISTLQYNLISVTSVCYGLHRHAPHRLRMRNSYSTLLVFILLIYTTWHVHIAMWKILTLKSAMPQQLARPPKPIGYCPEGQEAVLCGAIVPYVFWDVLSGTPIRVSKAQLALHQAIKVRSTWKCWLLVDPIYAHDWRVLCCWSQKLKVCSRQLPTWHLLRSMYMMPWQVADMSGGQYSIQNWPDGWRHSLKA